MSIQRMIAHSGMLTSTTRSQALQQMAGHGKHVLPASSCQAVTDEIRFSIRELSLPQVSRNLREVFCFHRNELIQLFCQRLHKLATEIGNIGYHASPD